MNQWKPNLTTKQAIDNLTQTMLDELPVQLGIDEIVPGCEVISTDTYGVGAGVLPRYITVALGGNEHVPVLFRGGVTVTVGQYVTVLHYRNGDLYEVLGAGGAAGYIVAIEHNLLSVTHGDTVANAAVQGYLIRGDGTPEWERFDAGAAGHIVQGDGADVIVAAFDWDTMAAGAGSDMVHDHSAAGEGGEVPLASLGDYTQGDIIYGDNADWQDLPIGNIGDVLTVNAGGTEPEWQAPGAAGNTLDEAYDQGGAGVGRTITADTGAVHIDGTDGLQVDNTADIQELRVYDDTELTIAAGVIARTQSYHRVDTQNDDPTDDLVTINGGAEGDILVIHPEDDARTIVVKHNVGNIWLIGEADISLEDTEDHLILIYDGAMWCSIGDGNSGGAGAPHNLLSATHPDTVANAPIQGYMIRGDGTPDWERFSALAAGFIVQGDGADAISAAFDWDTFSAGAGADMVHDHSAAGEGDEIPLASLGGYTRGDIIYGGAVDWQDLAVGAIGDVLTVNAGGTEPEWQALPAAGPHNLLSATHPDTDPQAVTEGSIIYGDATPEWTELVHPGAANRTLQSTAAQVGWVTNIVVPDGAWVGADANCAWMFDSTNGDVTTLDNVGIGTRTPLQNIAGGATDLAGLGLHVYNAAAQGRLIFEGNPPHFYLVDLGGGADEKVLSCTVDAGVAQWNIRNDAALAVLYTPLAIDMSNGYVGIGTTGPEKNLVVSGTDATLYSVAAGIAGFRSFILENLSATDGSFVGMGFRVTTGVGSVQRAYLGLAAGSGVLYDQSLVYASRTGAGTYAERFRIAGNGYVGIGTAAPDAMLDIGGGNQINANFNMGILLRQDSVLITGLQFENLDSAGESRFLVMADDGDYGMFTVPGSTRAGAWAGVNRPDGVFLVSQDSGRALVINAIAAEPIIFGTTNTERARIDSSGYVGIGVTGPAAMLHIDNVGTTAQPVLTLDQGDVSEEMMELITTIGVGNAIEAVGGKVLTTTHFIKITIPGPLTRYIPCGTIA